MNRLLLVLGIIFLSAQFASSQEVSKTWNNDLEVLTGMEKFDDGEHFAYSTYVYETAKSDIKKLISDEVESRTGSKTKNKKVIMGENIRLPGYEDKDVTVHAKTDDAKKMKDVVKVSVAFVHQGKDVSPQNYPDADKDARELIHKLGVKLNKAVVTEQIEDAQKELDDLTKKHEGATKDKQKLEEQNRDAETKIAKLQADKVKMEGKMNSAKAEEASMATLANSSTADAKDLKKYAKAKDKAQSAEKKYMNVDQDIAKLNSKISENQGDLGQLELELNQYTEQLETQKELVESLKTKLAAVK